MAEPIIQKLYKDKVEIKFFPDGHAYWVNGKRVSGVTTFIGILDKSRALIPWAVGLFKQYLTERVEKGITIDDITQGSIQHALRKEEAANIGTQVHDWIEKYIKDEEPEMPESKEAQIGVNAFLDWVKSNKVKFISSERVVYSKKYNYVGKMDIEAKVNGKLCLIDIKTSNGLYNSYNLQTAAYVKADEEESGRNYTGRWLIRVAKETESEFLNRMEEKGLIGKEYKVFEAKYLDDEMENINRDFKGFLACMELYRWNAATDPFLAKNK